MGYWSDYYEMVEMSNMGTDDRTYYIPYQRCDCGGKGTGRHKASCAYVRSVILVDGKVPPNIYVEHHPTNLKKHMQRMKKAAPYSAPWEYKAMQQVREFSQSTKGNQMSTLKFSTVNEGSKVQRLAVREVSKVSTAIRVVGLQYTRSLKEVAKLSLGAEFSLKVAPTNPYDANAVEVYLGSKKIGYIERGEAKQVCDVLNSLGENSVKAVVSRIDTRVDIYNMLWVVLEATFYTRA